MAHDPLDTVIGFSDTTKKDAAAAAKALTAARAALASGEREQSLHELRRAVNADPDNPEALFHLAFQLDLCGEEEESLALYERCCDQQPPMVNALVNLAVMYEDRGDYAAAERCLRQVLDTRPNHARAQLYMKDVLASREMVVVEEQDRDIFKRKALLDTPVTDFELSVRARTCLKKMNIRTLGDLLRITEAELLAYKNFGDSSLQEIRKMLNAKGLRLGQGLEDAHRAARRALIEQYKGTGKETVLAKPVAELQLSVRARKALQLLSIQTLGDLASHTEAELMGIKNFGATSLKEVRERLAEHGLSLRKLDS
ncbi:MAG: DNA-directed RNA polymerase subunit alpha C-terminal domain-containing protein [Planctomycetota bacterium]|nr:DNA-directed RNA polymerase subunit alpha C-terminal domain-containing protein [Planctomycetota bacterium]